MDICRRKCKLCRNIINDKNFVVIDDNVKEIFSIVLLKLNLDSETQYVMCKICSSKLMAALNFKATCLYTDNTIIPYVDFKSQKLVDLKEVYAKEKGNKQGNSILDDREICRLCLQQLGNKYKLIEEVPFNSVKIYIPEINFAITKNSKICIECYYALQLHATFIENCSAIEEELNMSEIDVGDKENKIKTDEAIKIVYNNVENEGGASLCSPNDLIDNNCENSPAVYQSEQKNTSQVQRDDKCIQRRKPRRHQLTGRDSSKRQVYKRDKYKFEDKPKRSFKTRQSTRKDALEVQTNESDESLRNHQSRHKVPSKVPMYRCDKCDYKSSQKYDLRRHASMHKDSSDMQIYGCNECSYKCFEKKSLSRHRRLIHTHSSEGKLYKCDKCKFKTYNKASFKNHPITYKDPSEVQMFKCGDCKYETKYKQNLKIHELKHKGTSGIPKYICGGCGYKSIRKYHLHRHVLIHRDPSKVRIYWCDERDYKSIQKETKNRKLLDKDHAEVPLCKCGQCGFESVNKRSLGTHQKVRHRNSVRRYECALCDYKGTAKANLDRHQLLHEDGAVQTYMCNDCDYKSIQKRNLKRHVLRHKDPAEVECSSVMNVTIKAS